MKGTGLKNTVVDEDGIIIASDIFKINTDEWHYIGPSKIKAWVQPMGEDTSDPRFNSPELWDMAQLLYEINREHSEGFTPYVPEDWREGWDQWVESNGYFKLISVVNEEGQ